MQEQSLERGLRFCTLDGALSTVWASLCGGIFLTGYALKVLNASAGQIGLLAALPAFANLTQILGAYLVEKTGEMKKIWFLCIVAHRTVWIFIILLPFAIFAPLVDSRVWVVVGVVGLSSVFASLSGLAWISWMSHLVPERTRGAYFGKRNMISSACGMAAVLFGGKLLSLWESRFPQNNAYGFMVLFTLGLAAGLIAVWYGLQVPRPQAGERREASRLDLSLFARPFLDSNYLTLMLFVAGLTFALQLTAPFYGVYLIENLKADFSTITLFMTAATLATLVMMKIWGPISDRMGNKPIIIVSGWVLIGIPFVWGSWPVPGNTTGPCCSDIS